MVQRRKQTEFGALLQRERKARHWTQYDFAAEAGILLNTLRAYERGERRPKREMLGRIARGLNLPVWQLEQALDGTATGEEQAGTSRRGFLALVAGVGLTLVERPAADQHSDELERILDLLGLGGARSIETVRQQAPLLRLFVYHDASAVRVSARRRAEEIEHSGWSPAEVAEGLSLMYTTESLAIRESCGKRGYKDAISKASAAYTQATNPSLPRRVQKQLWAEADLALGIVGRQLREQARSDRHWASAHLDVHHFYERCAGGRDPLMDAACSGFVITEVWSRSELSKRYASDGDLEHAQQQFLEARRKLDSGEFLGSPLSRFLVPGVYEGWARAMIDIIGATEDARTILQQAASAAGHEITRFQVALTLSSLCLHSGRASARLDGAELLQGLRRRAPVGHQEEKAERLAEQYGLPDPPA
jgi:transcriptional regulator with XRE-family HTH domain